MIRKTAINLRIRRILVETTGLKLFCCAALLSVLLPTTNGIAPVYVPKAEPLKGSESVAIQTALPTVTVRGFLNFRTTVDGTVIVFTPASDTTNPAPSPPSQAPQSTKAPSAAESKEGSEFQDLAYTQTPVQDNVGGLKKDRDLDNDAINNILPSSRSISPARTQPTPPLPVSKTKEGSSSAPPTNRPTPSIPQYPTGLVTVLGGTQVINGATTIHETKVIGTYIDGKYAQILQSTSRIIFSSSGTQSSTESVTSKPEIKPTPVTSLPARTSSATLVSSSRQQDQKDRSGIRQEPSPSIRSSVKVSSTESERQKSASRNSFTSPGQRRDPRDHDNSFSTNTLLQSSFKVPDSNPHRASRPTHSYSSSSRTGYSTHHIPPRRTTVHHSAEENTVAVTKRINRPGTGAARFVLPQRQTPRVRLNRFKVKLTLRQDPSEVVDEEAEDTIIHEDNDDPLISVDPARVIKEIQTITSEVTLHVGRRKSVRTLTIITTVRRTVEPTDLVSNGLIEPTEAANNELLATSVADSGETPPLVISRTYTTTERTWRTSLVPVLDGQSTTTKTVTESFFIMKLITAYRTMPPGEFLLLNQTSEMDTAPSLDESWSLQTAFLQGPAPLPPSPQQQLLQTPLPQAPPLQTSGGLDASLLALASSGNLPALQATSGTNPLQLANNPLLTALQHPLAAVYLGLQQLNRQVTLYSTITKTSSYVTTDTVYSTKVVSFYDGRRTRFRTLSEPVSTTEKTITTFSTTVQPYLNTQALQQQQAQLQQLIATQIQPAAPQYSTLTSTITTVSTGTSISTRIYTLIYNAFSTKFRTVSSTSLYETTITTTSTTEVPIPATAPPGSYPFLG